MNLFEGWLPVPKVLDKMWFFHPTKKEASYHHPDVLQGAWLYEPESGAIITHYGWLPWNEFAGVCYCISKEALLNSLDYTI